MDKLRALEYFVAAAQAQSLAGAARRFEVSTSAVAKMITGLERSLGARLFERTVHGLTLTATGQGYLDTCGPLLEQIAIADEAVRTATKRVSGDIAVGVQPMLARHCLAPELPRFNALYPDVRLDIRDFSDWSDADAHGVDVFLALGWPPTTDLIMRKVGVAGYRVCASAGYWKDFGIPEHPRDLAKHRCIVIRSVAGAPMDQWTFQRGDEREQVSVRGWLVASSAHRDAAVEVVEAGGGVARVMDLFNRDRWRDRSLVPVLTDWELTEAPPINLMYRSSVRRVPRIRAFMDFVATVFSELEAQSDRRLTATVQPDWLRSHYRRAPVARGRR